MKTNCFFQQAAYQLLLILIIIGCKPATEPIYKAKYHNDIFGIFQTPDGGLLITLSRINEEATNCGFVKCKTYLTASTFGDICLIKTDANGNVLWEKVVEEKSDETNMTARMSPDGNLLIAGTTSTRGTNPNGFIAKFNLEGVLLWKKIFEIGVRAAFSISSEGAMVRSIQLPGISRYGFKVFDAKGDIKWQYIPSATIEGALIDAICLENGEILAFYPKLLQKFDKDGTLLWSRPVDWQAEYAEKAKGEGFWVKWGNKIGRFNNNGELTGTTDVNMLNGRLTHFAINASGDLLALTKSTDGSNALNYVLIDNSGQLKSNRQIGARTPLPKNGVVHVINPKFVQILPDKSMLLVEKEDINVNQSGSYTCNILLSKLSETGTRLWTTTIATGEWDMMMGGF
jgi:hypothetical protein